MNDTRPGGGKQSASSPFKKTARNGPTGTGGHNPVEKFVHSLRGLGKKVKGPNGTGQYEAQCPAHEDSKPSLGVTAGDDGRVLLRCRAGCKWDDIVRAVGLSPSDLWPGDGPERNGQAKETEVSRTKPRQVAEYVYRGEDGEPLYKVIRLECTVTVRRPDGETVQRTEKTFRQMRPTADGWVYGIDGVRRVPYMLPELLAAPADATIYLVEGEECAHALTALGLVATTTSGGAHNWGKADLAAIRKALAGRKVVILPDNDEPGRQYAAAAVRDLLPVAAEVKVLELPGLPEHGDIVDWLADDHTVAELEGLAAELAPEAPESPDGSSPGDPWPDPIPLAEEPAVPAFPADALPRPLWVFARRLAWVLNAPEDFVGTTMLALAAGAIGNARRLKLSATHQQPALLYAALVGLPGTVKSPVMKFLTGPLDDIQTALNEQFVREMEEWQAARGDDDEGRGPRPQLKLVVARNFTTESLALALHHNPRGIVTPFDELAGLFLGLNQYKGGGGNDRQFYLSVWAQETINVLRKSDLKDGVPPIFVVNPCVSIVGGIQPDLLSAIRGKAARKGDLPPDDGGLDRFLFTWPATLPDIADESRNLTQTDLQVWPGIIKRLVKDLGDGEVALSEDGRSAWVEFTRAHAAEVNDDGFPDHLRGPWAKMKAYCARLALTLHLLDWAAGVAADAGRLDGAAVRRATKLIDYFKAHARKVNAHIGADTRVEQARRVVKRVKDLGRPRFSERDVFEGVKGTIKTMIDLRPILELLADHHLIREADPPVRPAGKSAAGRKPSPVYEVNPRILTDPDFANSANSAKGFRRPPEEAERAEADTAAAEGGSQYSHNSPNGRPDELYGTEDLRPMKG